MVISCIRKVKDISNCDVAIWSQFLDEVNDLGDTSTLADPGVVENLVETRRG